MNPNSGQKLRVDAYIIHFLANDKDFAKAFSAAVKNASNLGDKDNAFQTVLDEVRAEMYKNRRLMAKEGEPGYEQVRVDSYHIANSQDQIRKLMREQIKPAIEAGKPVTRIVEDFYKTQPNSNLVPPPGNGIKPPMKAQEPKITSYTAPGGGEIDMGKSPLTHAAKDGAGNAFEVSISNPSGFINEATVTCANGDKVNVSKAAKALLKEIQSAAPKSGFMGIGASPGGLSPIAPHCAPTKQTTKTP